MTAIITNQFRIQNLQYAKRDIDSGIDDIFLAVGRASAWDNDTNPPAPNIDPQDEMNARLNFQSMKKVADIVPCVARYNWTSGNTYVAWDNNDPTLATKQFYVLNQSTFNVYICLRAGSGASTVEPTGTSTGNPTEGADGYVWKYLYTITGAQGDKFLTSDFMPVLRDSSVAAAATAGQIWDYNIVEGGTGYGSAPTVTIEGDGSGATATATIDGGVLTGITVTAVGSGYTYALAVLTGGSASTEASITPVLSPISLGRELTGVAVTNAGSSYPASSTLALTIVGDGFEAAASASTDGSGTVSSVSVSDGGYGYTNLSVTVDQSTAGTTAVLTPQFSAVKGGFGYDPVVDLQAHYLMFNVILQVADGIDQGGDFVINNDYRQLALIKNPLDTSGTQLKYTSDTGTAMPFVTVTGGTWIPDDLITGGTSTAQAYVLYYDSANTRVYYVQDETTGFDAFSDGEALSGPGGSSGTIDSGGHIGVRDIDNFSGRMLYLENRVAVSRAADQTEDIKLVVQF